MSWQLAVSRDDLSRTQLCEQPLREPGDGDAVLRVDRVGVTANNVTYAVLGDAFRYWEFFPAGDGLGLVPLWGFAEVVATRAAGVQVGQRVYGYLPTAGHLLVRPDRVGPHGFRDASPHRSSLPSPYNAYALTTGDAAYEADREDLQVLFRPLFVTSWMLADQLEEQPAEALVISSASSKTAYGTAHLLRAAGREVVGLTSPGNMDFTRSLGVYTSVLSYDDVTCLAAAPTAYVDVAGSTPLRERLHAHLRGDLVLDLVVGITHQDGSRAAEMEGARPSTFFAPDRMRQRTADWGRPDFDARYAAAWQGFAPRAQGWVDVVEGHGPEGLRSAWLEVLSGTSAPRTGHVVQL